ncbi:unnamed protein product [Tilletia controversa]|uniref:Uncharacterized protein n=1 Tax=Tilletia controversa TaxID=13291 RepID=A0A8X7MZS3_9BASI|nr:hypothetical protein CF328_g2763 [Tilletia controversa]KAE8253448.1 hypothetical protein A4X06_0g1453 [Tilletia controversa]CAD6948605.1 unnamed protein product [Tilletia controversa]CAD6983705.1 unnamed protein product [Tilletia controversa]
MSSGLLSDRTLAFATTPCFRIDVSDVARLQSFPGDSVQGTLKISNKFLGSGSSNSSYHSIDVTIKAEARIRSSIHMPQGNVVPTFEKISLWKLGRVQLWPRPSTSEPDELGLVSIPFTVKVPLTVPALSNLPFASHISGGKRSSQQQVAQVVQIAPLPSCTLPPGLQIVVSIVAEAHRTSALVKRPREDIVQVPILLHRKPSDKLLRWLPPVEDPNSHLLRFDPHFWTSSTTIVTLKQTLLDRRRLWITLTIPNVSRTNGAAESERIPFLLELTYQSKRSSSSSRGPPFNMVDKTALPALPLSTTKSELQPRLFVGQRVACTLEDGTTSDFRQDDLEIEWDPFHLEHIPTLAATTSSSSSNTQNSSSFTPRDRVQLRLGASSSGLELFQGHGWTLPERKSINEIKAFRKSLERGEGAGADLDSVDDVVGVDDEGDEEDDGGAHESSMDSKDRSLSHHTSSAFSTLRKALLPSADPDTVGYWISRAAISGTFHAPPALPSFDFSFGPPLRKDAKESGSGFESSSSCARGHLSLGYELGVSWTVPESVAAGPDDPRSAHGKKRTIVTFKTFERGLVPWFSSSTGSYPSASGDQEQEQGQGRGGRRSDIGTGATAFPPTRADTLRNAKAKCKAAKLGRTEPNLSLAETEALDEEAENGGGKGKTRSTNEAQFVARPEKHDEDDEDEDEAGGTEGQERRRRLRERNALLFNLPPGYFAATSDFEDMPKTHSDSSSAAAAVAGAGVGAGQAPEVQHNHPVKN